MTKAFFDLNTSESRWVELMADYLSDIRWFQLRLIANFGYMMLKPMAKTYVFGWMTY